MHGQFLISLLCSVLFLISCWLLMELTILNLDFFGVQENNIENILQSCIGILGHKVSRCFP